MENHLKIIGYLFVLLAFIHLFFSKYFNWKNELKDLSLINKQMMEVHTFFIALFVFGNGLLNIICSNELVNNPLGKKISFGLFVFWFLCVREFVRLVEKKRGKGKTGLLGGIFL